MAGKLTTHVLDTARGTQGGGMRVTLRRIEPDASEPQEFTLDGTGRATLLEGPEMKAGKYEIVFFVGEYQERQGLETSDHAFLDDVPVRFGMADPASHYHVPLVMSRFGYSTYRGG